MNQDDCTFGLRLSPIRILSLGTTFLLLSCAGPIQPIINYTPLLWDGTHHAHASALEIEVYTMPTAAEAGTLTPERIAALRELYDWPERPLKIIGSGYVPLKVGTIQSCLGPQDASADITADEAVMALRQEAVRRGADVIFVYRTQQQKQTPAIGGLNPYGGYYVGSGTIVAVFMNAYFGAYK